MLKAIFISIKKGVYIFFTLIACLFASRSSSQHPVDEKSFADSLQKLLLAEKADTAKADILFQLADYWSYRDTAKAMQYIDKAVQLSRNNKYYTALAHFYAAGIYFDYNISKSQQEYMLAEALLKDFSTEKAFQYRARLWHNYGVLEQKKDNEKYYLDILLNKAIPFSQKAKDTLRTALNFMDAAAVFMNKQQHDKAIEYYNNALNILRRYGNKYGELADCYTNTAKAYLATAQYDKARIYLDSAYTVLSSNNQSPYFATYYTISGMYYNNVKKYDSAIIQIDKGLLIAKENKLTYEEASLLFQRYIAYTGIKQYAKAKQALLQADELNKQIQLTGNRRLILLSLAKTDSLLGNLHGAYNWLLQYSILSDSFFITNTNAQIAELETKYQSEKKEKQILTLESKGKQQIAALEHNRFINYILLSSIVILFLLLLLLYLSYKNKQRNAKLKEEASLQKIKQMEQLQQLQVYNAMLKGQEAERKRLAQDLHDGLGGMLAGVKIGLSNIAENTHQKPSDMELYKVINQLDHSVDELRRIARNLMPETLLRFGIEAALKDLCENISNNKTKVVFQAYGLSNEISQQNQIMIYRIVQELTANAVKYADAEKVLVQCMQQENIMQITVEDNGKGFDVAKKKSKSMGLLNVENRVNYLKGKMEIQSDNNIGTTINIEVDVQ
ncbi:ATP-binding protein [Parafilimonas terrae]|uniref:histidine kinase n=1 Tax=Parafilimonas terrae TaxID=1465490 RepID=A0A1I5UE40_9BACT|nr:sensor histidine kinase [Parafilimonas terrae]SFP93521.1 Histidine kinase-, DNA gyrase B-, and HSP90-like ATPase [Parafilimonas terrae]